MKRNLMYFCKIVHYSRMKILNFYKQLVHDGRKKIKFSFAG